MQALVEEENVILVLAQRVLIIIQIFQDALLQGVIDLICVGIDQRHEVVVARLDLFHPALDDFDRFLIFFEGLE